MTTSYLLNAALIGPLLLQAGCDAKAGDAYQGEPLLSFHGSVRLEDTTALGQLKPALAFVPQDGVVSILDVEVRGSFPASFNLDVLEPPSDASMISASGVVLSAPRAQRIAIGYITAVPVQHPATLRVATSMGYRYTCEGNNVPSTMPMSFDTPKDYILRYDLEQLMQEQRMWHRGQPGQTCSEEIAGFVGDTPDQMADYQQVSHCDYTFEHCEVESSRGDPEIARSPWKKIAGLSTNYQVLYLPEAVEAGAPVSRAYGGGGALTMGYHLLEVVASTPESETSYWECVGQVNPVELYNAKYGTHFMNIDDLYLMTLQMKNPSLDNTSPEWARGERELEQEEKDLWYAGIAERCADSQPAFARPVDPAQASISVEISAHVTPQRSLQPAL